MAGGRRGQHTLVGGPLGDFLYGGAGSDSIDGGGGDDTILGGDAADTLAGGNASDFVMGGLGDDSVDGGTGDDTVWGWDGSDTVVGGDGSDVIEGGRGDDSLDGALGADTIIGGGGNDTLDGQAGADSLYGGHGHDLLRGGDGDDTLGSDLGRDTFFGGAGDDQISGGPDDDWLDGGDGSDLLDGGSGQDRLMGGPRETESGRPAGCDNDTLRGGQDNDTMDGGRGADLLDATEGDNELTTDLGRDTILAGSGRNRIYHRRKSDPTCRRGGRGQGDAEPDATSQVAGDLVIHTGPAADHVEISGTAHRIRVAINGMPFEFSPLGQARLIVRTGAGDDAVQLGSTGIPVAVGGGLGNDTLIGGPAADTLRGGAGRDLLRGADGADWLAGGPDRDTLVGGAGNDRLLGGPDAVPPGQGSALDLVRGGPGQDTIDNSDGTDRLFGRPGFDIFEHVDSFELLFAFGDTHPATAVGDSPAPATGVTSSLFGLDRPHRFTLGGGIGAHGGTPSDADLSVGHAGVPASVGYEQAFSYNVEPRNAGTHTAQAVRIVISTGADTTINTLRPSRGSCAPQGSEGVCDFNHLPVGAMPSIEVNATSPESATEVPLGTVVSSQNLDPQAQPPSAIQTPLPVEEADLSITKHDAPDPVNVGVNLSYTITVTNAGPDAALGTVVVDTLPSTVSFVSASAGCTHSGGTLNSSGVLVGGTVTCNLGTVATSASAQVGITVRPTVSGTISNSARVSSRALDTNPTDNQAIQVTTVGVAAPASENLTITKTDLPDPVSFGSSLTYIITVTKTGTGPANNVKVTDVLPSGVQLQPFPPGSNCTGTQTITCELRKVQTSRMAVETRGRSGA